MSCGSACAGTVQTAKAALRRIATALVIGLTPWTAQACEYLEPFQMGQIAGADLVIVGRVTGFEMIETTWGAALVTVEVEEALKGRLSGEVTFVWNGGTAMGPHPSRAEGILLIGAMKGGRLAQSDRGPDMRPDLPSIIQPYCGEVWMQTATTAVVAEAREALE
jgi:hypothetical protein